MKWDRLIWNKPDEEDSSPVLAIKHLFHWERFGFRIDLHKIMRADAENMFHSHPAIAWRVILWGGYVEEVLEPLTTTGRLNRDWQRNMYLRDGRCPCGIAHKVLKSWLPGDVGRVEPEFIHRIDRLIKGPSYSLWFRFRCTHDIYVGGVVDGQVQMNELSHVVEDQ